MSDYDMKCPKCFMLYNWQRGHVCPMPPRSDLPPRAAELLRRIAEMSRVVPLVRIPSDTADMLDAIAAYMEKQTNG